LTNPATTAEPTTAEPDEDRVELPLELVENLHAQGPEALYRFLVEIAAEAEDPDIALDVIDELLASYTGQIQ
jgi:hypothetical protein